MAKHDDIPKTDPSEIEALIKRLKQSNLEPRDAQLVERLLRLVLSLASILQHKNASIRQLKRLIFVPGSDKRTTTESPTENAAAEPGVDSDQQPGSDSGLGTARSPSTDQKPKWPGHGRMTASAYTGTQVMICRHPDFKSGDHCLDPLCSRHLYPPFTHQRFSFSSRGSRWWARRVTNKKRYLIHANASLMFMTGWQQLLEEPDQFRGVLNQPDSGLCSSLNIS
jgi:hypothetical protein